MDNGFFAAMQRQEFNAYDDTMLIWTCIKPVILLIRGKNFSIKSEVYTRMTTAQRALLMFQMLYGHTSEGVIEFYTHLSYLLSNNGVWMQLKKAMQYFGDDDMLNLLNEMDIVFQSLNAKEFHENAEQYNSNMEGVQNNSALFASLGELDTALHHALPSTIQRVSTYIRNHPDEFVRFQD